MNKVMEAFVRLQCEMARLRSRRGQNTVEYLLMLAVIVGVALVLGKMFKGQIGSLFSSIMAKIQGASDSLAGGQ